MSRRAKEVADVKKILGSYGSITQCERALILLEAPGWSGEPSKMNAKVQRVQFDVPEDRLAELQELMKSCGIETRKDLFNNALTLLEWAVRESARGRTIASVSDDEKSYRELQMPILFNASRSAA